MHIVCRYLYIFERIFVPVLILCYLITGGGLLTSLYCSGSGKETIRISAKLKTSASINLFDLPFQAVLPNGCIALTKI